MTYAGIQMFNEKLNQLINCNDHPLMNISSIINERPQFQLLYQDIGSLIQTLFNDQHQGLHELEKVNDLMKRFINAAEEAQYIVDLFVSGVQIRNNGHFPTSEDFKQSLNLDDVRRSFKSVQEEFTSMIVDKMKLDSSQRPERTLNQSAEVQISSTRYSLRSKKLLDEVILGLDEDVVLIRDKLVEDQKKLDVVSIVGMGGIGKTTLATKVFNDGYVKHHFHVRVWVTVSQTYDKRDVLIQILESVRDHSDLEKASDSRLRELVHKNLIGKRYFIVIDDIWHIETWDKLRLFFPHDNNGSRILLTSRLTEVAKHANSDGLIHQLGYLNKEKGWKLLCQKVFHGNEFPKWSIKPGMQIVENCKGLPLAVDVIAGVLAKESLSEKFWVEIAYKTGSYIVYGQNGFIMETLGLSYNHLPLHLRECFLYLGGFPEDYKFEVQSLIWLWVAEGFIQQTGNRSLEDTAEGFLMDLIDRNLVTVTGRRKSNGAVKAFKVHDFVRELCLRKAMEEQFILQTERLKSSAPFDDVITQPYKPVRMFISKDASDPDLAHPPARNLRSISCFCNFISLSGYIAEYLRSFVLLRVLDLRMFRLNDFPKGMELLVHLRYLAIWKSSSGFPSSMCNLWGLQTLIYITDHSNIELPSNISNLVNLRHLLTYYPGNIRSIKWYLYLPSIEKPMNLQTFSHVKLGDGVDFQTCFPYIKELGCILDKKNDFKSLIYLEKLKLNSRGMQHITLPATLKTLTLAWCGLPWSEMSIIQSLPNLQVLKLHQYSFEGSCWKTDEHEFRKLEYLRLKSLDIKLWKADSTSFPCLKQLEIEWCEGLEEIPLEFGEIPTLEHVGIMACWPSIGKSVKRIRKKQQDFGNYDLKINVRDELV